MKKRETIICFDFCADETEIFLPKGEIDEVR